MGGFFSAPIRWLLGRLGKPPAAPVVAGGAVGGAVSLRPAVGGTVTLGGAP